MLKKIQLKILPFLIGVLNFFVIVQLGLIETLNTTLIEQFMAESHPLLQNLALAGALMATWKILNILWMILWSKAVGE